VGSTQNIEDVEAKVGTLVKDSQELRDIIDCRPIYSTPFDGVGNTVKRILGLILQKLEKNSD
jgi:hypothetical protein